MNRSHIFGRAALLAAFISGFAAPAFGQEWVSLFNGRNLDGWQQLNGKAKYEARDGAIVGTSVPDSPNSFLCTKRNYSDFELEFEVKVDAALNSGVQIRSESKPDYRDGRVHGYQVEIAVGGLSGAIYDEARRAKMLNAAPLSDELKTLVKANEWAKYRVVCRGDRIQTWVNGRPVTDLTDSMTRSGFIGLQVHGVGKRADPLTVSWRNIRLKVLVSAAVAADAPAPRSVKNLRLAVSPNGRHFVDQNGRPFFYLGDTCWLLFQRLNREEVDEYLQDRVAKGFTVIQAYVLRGLGKNHPDRNASLRDATPLVDRDPTRPNEEFFKNVDYVINRANELGLVVGLVTAKSWHVVEHAEKVFDEKNAYAFARFLGERYRNNAVIWFPGGDSAPGAYDAIWVAMAKGHQAGSGGRHLVCYHGKGGTSSSMWFHQADWLDFNSIQSGHNFRSDSYAFVSKDYALTPAKPTLDMEPAYENHATGANNPRIDAHKVRSQAYSAMLAGAAGHGYGAMDLFWFYHDADGPFPKNGYQHWRTAMGYEGSRQVGLMRRLFEQRPWHRMLPDQSVIASAPGDGTQRVVAARAVDGSFVVVYTPVGQPVSIHLNKLSGSRVNAQWYDPRNGTWKAIGQYSNKGIQEFVAPSRGEKDDWVLVLDASG